MREVLAALVTPRERVEAVRRRIEEAGITSSFFLCATPRTGSTMLAAMLASSGVVGRPREYFNIHSVPGRRVRIGDYLIECTASGQSTGVFCTKLHWDQLEPFLYRLRRLRGAGRLSDGALIEAVLPTPRYVWLTRDDVLAQAVSWWRAKVTRVFLQGRDAQLADPVFDFEAIRERVGMIEEQNAGWRHWFDANAIEPLRVGYDELVADPAGVVERILPFLGVTAPERFVAEPRTQKQADDLTDEWIRRYRELAGQADPSG